MEIEAQNQSSAFFSNFVEDSIVTKLDGINKQERFENKNIDSEDIETTSVSDVNTHEVILSPELKILKNKLSIKRKNNARNIIVLDETNSSENNQTIKIQEVKKKKRRGRPQVCKENFIQENNKIDVSTETEENFDSNVIISNSNKNSDIDEDNNICNVEITTIEQSLYSEEQTFYIKNRWEIVVDKFNNGSYSTNNKIMKYFDNVREGLVYVDDHGYKNKSINPGIKLSDKQYLNFINQLPNDIKDDYLHFRNEYCLINYGYIIDIFRALNGLDDYQYKIGNQIMLPLYFNTEEKDLINNKLIYLSSEKDLIDVGKSYCILQNKVRVKLHLINKEPNHMSSNVYASDGPIIMNLPFYQKDDIVPQFFFSYLHLMIDFVQELITEDDVTRETIVICPREILSYLNKYYMQLQFIERHCFI